MVRRGATLSRISDEQTHEQAKLFYQVTTFHGSSEEDNSFAQELQGRVHMREFVSAAGYLEVQLMSDASIELQGFAANYEAVQIGEISCLLSLDVTCRKEIINWMLCY